VWDGRVNRDAPFHALVVEVDQYAFDRSRRRVPA
jgi:hypothetical protein